MSYRLVPKWIEHEHGSCVYEQLGQDLIQSEHPAVVMDIGAGRQFALGADIHRQQPFTLIGVDVDGEELKFNETVDKRIVTDASKSLCVDDGSVDMILSQFAIEHIPNNTALLRNCFDALKPGGSLLVVFQGRLAPSSILNRILPSPVKSWLLRTLVPNSDGRLGFPAFYDKCRFDEFQSELVKRGFDVEIARGSYYSSDYFAFFVPLFSLALGIDLLRRSIGNPNLASQLLFLARKPQSAAASPTHVTARAQA